MRTAVATPPRRMPSLHLVEQASGATPGYCLRCGQPARCERAHLVDRVYGGADDVSNLVPLCYPCHRDQPSFAPGQEEAARKWVSTTDFAEWSGWLLDHLGFPVAADVLRGYLEPAECLTEDEREVLESEARVAIRAFYGRPS